MYRLNGRLRDFDHFFETTKTSYVHSATIMHINGPYSQVARLKLNSGNNDFKSFWWVMCQSWRYRNVIRIIEFNTTLGQNQSLSITISVWFLYFIICDRLNLGKNYGAVIFLLQIQIMCSYLKITKLRNDVLTSSTIKQYLFNLHNI
jgi:hypothetical protein